MKIYHYSGCSTCKKALKFLRDRQAEFTEQELVLETPSAETLRDLWQRSGLPLRRFFNTSGKIYRSEGYKDKLPTMDEDAQLAALASQGMLIKRPILDLGDQVLVGFSEKAWGEALG